jgi:cbb3-type cytochrome c oxidase subunit III
MRWSQRLAIGTVGVIVLAACESKQRADQVDTQKTVTAEAQRMFNGDTAVARQGRILFLQNNCYGCHGGLAGGGMGPSLRDTTWKYGGTDSAIYSSIRDGRPMGMPRWGSALTPGQIGTLVVYVQSLRSPAESKVFFWAAGTDSETGSTR